MCATWTTVSSASRKDTPRRRPAKHVASAWQSCAQLCLESCQRTSPYLKDTHSWMRAGAAVGSGARGICGAGVANAGLTPVRLNCGAMAQFIHFRGVPCCFAGDSAGGGGGAAAQAQKPLPVKPDAAGPGQEPSPHPQGRHLPIGPQVRDGGRPRALHLA